jgi:hypothetical protein
MWRQTGNFFFARRAYLGIYFSKLSQWYSSNNIIINNWVNKFVDPVLLILYTDFAKSIKRAGLTALEIVLLFYLVDISKT